MSFFRLIFILIISLNLMKCCKIFRKGDVLIDCHGRRRVFHGVNVVNKEPPFLPNDFDAERFSEQGLNVIRLGFTWAAVEYEPFTYNHTYLRRLRELVQEAYPMYVIIDNHQDMLSSSFGSYDSIPKWLLKRYPYSDKRWPWPLSKAPCNVFLNYFTLECSHAFQCIYNNTADSLTHLARMWRTVVESTHDLSNVLGYDLFNEPWVGDYFNDLSLFWPKVAFERNLLPMYRKVIEEIRKVDSEMLLFYEPLTWGRAEEIGYYQTAPSMHYYCWLLLNDVDQKPTSVFTRFLCSLSKFSYFDDFLSGAFLTEFGACNISGPGTSCYDDILDTLQLADSSNLVSWAYWVTTFPLEDSALSLLSRCFPQAVSGNITEFHFNPVLHSCILSFDVDHSVNKSSELVLPKMHFHPGNFTVDVSKGVSVDFKSPILYITWKDKSVEHVTVKASGLNYS